MDRIPERIEIVKRNIASACKRVGREPDEVKLVVVTKSTSIEGIIEVLKSGHRDLGENRVQQLKKVASQVDELIARGDLEQMNVNWNMIGHLQRNKVKQVLPIVGLIHSVDTLRLAEEINNVAAKEGIQARILLQVNTSQEPQKYGVPVGAATHLAEQLQTLENLRVCGLMTMAPLTRDKDAIRSCFMRAKEIFDEIKGERMVSDDFTELSMGMSSDYEIAIEEGATIVRIGSAIFAG